MLARSRCGVLVRSLDTGETLFNRDADKLTMPASNMKIVTMAAAAERLGWEYRFETTVTSEAPVVDGRLEGDLVVIGSGDPTLNARHDRAAKILEDVALQLWEGGLRRIAGRIVADDNAFDDREIGPGWSWDYLQYGYAAPVSAIAFYENLVEIRVRPGAAEGEAAQVEVTPSTSDLTIVNRAVTAAADADTTVDLVRERGSRTLHVAGAIATGAEPFRRTAAVQNPSLSFASALRDALIRRGIAVDGDAMDIDDIAPAAAAPIAPIAPTAPVAPLAPLRTVLARITSPPLWEIGTVLMKASQNLYAEMLFRTLGGGTIEGARRAVGDILTAWEIAPDSYVLADGSGLSRYNYVTPEALVAVLTRMHADARHRERFAATLPTAGRDGALARRMLQTRAEGNARAKTGAIANVRALSGYVTTRDGEALVFSIVANHFTSPMATIDEVMDRAVETLANSSRSGKVRRVP